MGQALALNTMDSNTAIGAASLLLNSRGAQNTAVGNDALFFNGSGDVSGDSNTAIGYSAVMNNITGGSNTAGGWEALTANIGGVNNVALGTLPLSTNASGNNNTAIGHLALMISDTTSDHVAIGRLAGSAITTADNNIIIGHSSGVHPDPAFGQVSDRCFIDNIYGAPVSSNSAPQMVMVDSAGRLGTFAADADPGGFLAKQGIQPQAIPDSAKQTMLTLELQSLEATISQQQNQIEMLSAQIREQIEQIRKVNARLEISKPAAQIIVNKTKAVPEGDSRKTKK